MKFDRHDEIRTETYIKNVPGVLRHHAVKQLEYSVFVGERTTCWISSLFTLQITFMIDECRRLTSINTAWRLLMRLLLGIRKLLAAAVSIDRAAYVNHSLTSTTLWPKRMSDRGDLLSDVCRRYPGHAILFRTLNFQHNRELIDSLVAGGCRLLPYRKIACFDPLKPLSAKKRRNLSTDLRLLHEGGYVVRGKTGIREKDLRRIHDLYMQLYISKYSKTNPQYSMDFFQKLLDSESVDLFCLERGAIDAFGISIERDGVITYPLFGYDTSKKDNSGLYRQASAVIFKTSNDRGILLNDSGGALKFKMIRGAVLEQEYCAVYIEHLPVVRRYGWRLYIWFMQKTWALVEEPRVKAASKLG